MTLSDDLIRLSLHAPLRAAAKPRLGDQELYQLLMAAHGWITQHTVLGGPAPSGRTNRPEDARANERTALLARLQAAWEALPPA